MHKTSVLHEQRQGPFHVVQLLLASCMRSLLVTPGLHDPLCQKIAGLGTQCTELPYLREENSLTAQGKPSHQPPPQHSNHFASIATYSDPKQRTSTRHRVCSAPLLIPPTLHLPQPATQTARAPLFVRTWWLYRVMMLSLSRCASWAADLEGSRVRSFCITPSFRTTSSSLQRHTGHVNTACHTSSLRHGIPISSCTAVQTAGQHYENARQRTSHSPEVLRWAHAHVCEKVRHLRRQCAV